MINYLDEIDIDSDELVVVSICNHQHAILTTSIEDSTSIPPQSPQPTHHHPTILKQLRKQPITLLH